MIKRTLLLGFAVLVFRPFAAVGQDPVPIYPENYKVLLENDRVRVLDFKLRKGAREEMHSHPAHVLYVLSPFRVRFTLPGGETRMRETRAGEVLFSDSITHSPVNVGETDAHGILVELKSGPAGKAAAAPEGDWLTAITFIRGLEGKEEELKRELLALEAPTRAEPGNIVYDLYQSLDKKNEFVRFEEWRDLAALEEHKGTPHLKASFERRKAQGWATEITLWKRVRK